MYWPNIWSVLFPTVLSSSLDKAGPKHSTSVPSSGVVAVPLSVEVKEVALVPNPVSVVTVKGLSDPQGPGSSAVLCSRVHSLVSASLQMVIPFTSPTVHWKVIVSPGQVGGAPVNCPASQPWGEYILWLKVGKLWITNLQVMWMDEWVRWKRTQNSQKVYTKLLSLHDKKMPKKLNF